MRIAMQTVKYVLIALLLVTPFRWFIAQPFIVSGASMAPVFEPYEYVIIDKLTYRFHEPERGDVIIFRYPLDPSTFFIKRVVGLPGETVEIKNGVITITATSGAAFVLKEPYVSSTMGPARPLKAKLADDEFFVLGDNRNASADSREWGALQKKFIAGRALVSLYPVRDMALFPGKYRF